jgi:radical SAM protein with 4Fe4S-binding SPASM domain
VEIQFLVFEHNKGDVENMKKLSGELGVDSLLVRSGFVPDGRRLEGYYTWDSGRDFCRRFWYCAIVNCDGGVVPCCRFFYKKDDFGNAFSDGFSSVWNNKLYQSVREAVAKGEVNSLPKVCRDCRKYVGRK